LHKTDLVALSVMFSYYPASWSNCKTQTHLYRAI